MKRRRQATAFREGIEPTPEQIARGDWETTEAPRIEGHDHGNVRVKRRRSPILRWINDGWVSPEQAKALAEYDQLLARANYGRVKSCLNVQEGGRAGHWTLSAPDRTMEARSEVMALQARLYRLSGDLWGGVRPVLWLVDELTVTDPVKVRAEHKRAWLPKLADELRDYFR